MVRLKDVTLLLQFAAELIVIVDFAVEHNANVAVQSPHWLFSAGLIDDGKPAVAEIHSGGFIDPESLFVGTPAAHDVIHSFQVRERAATDKSANSAHIVRPYTRLKSSLTA